MKHGSLFSGIGGFDLAAQWMGWENVFHVERNPFCQKVLNYHFPQAKSYEDIKEFDGTEWRGKVDIISGGFPCQPYSTAGKRLGKNDERHLWPEMLRIIRESAPRFVVGENVRGLVSWDGGMVFEEVCLDLEIEGYEVWTGILPAASVGAPHRRDRIFFVAVHASNTNCRGLERAVEVGWDGVNVEREGIVRDASNAEFLRLEHGKKSGDARVGQETTRECFAGHASSAGQDGNSSYSDGEVLQCRDGEGAPGRSAHQGERAEPLGKSGCWEVFPTQSPVCGGDDGLPRQLDGITFSKWRKESIMAYGNAVVPQVAYEIFQSLTRIDSFIDSKRA